MKKCTLICLFFAFIFAPPVSKAQNAYEKGDRIANLGFSLGHYGYGLAGTRSGGFIPLTASLEFGVHENISVGPYVGYASWNYDYAFNSFRSSYSSRYFSVGAKGSFHYLSLMNQEFNTNLNEQKLDFYLSLFLGLENRSFGYDDQNDPNQRNNVSRVIFAPVLGFKYLFTPNVGAFLELGRGTFGYLSLGVSANF